MKPPSKQKNPALIRRVTLIALLLLSCLLMALYANEGESGVLHSIQRTVSFASSPFQLAGSALDAGADSVEAGMSDAVANEETLSALKETNAQLRLLLTEAAEYKKQAEELQSLLDLKDSYAAEGVAARVIGKSSTAWDRTITIDKGSQDGIGTGLSVMGPYGLIGQVVSASSHTATVRLLTDSQSGAAAMIQSTREKGIVRGSLEGYLYLENIDDKSEVNEGDVVITSGLGGSYVGGLLIGTVVKVDDTKGSSSRLIMVAPNDSVSSLETVLVVFSTDASYSAFSQKDSAEEGASEESSAAESQTGE